MSMSSEETKTKAAKKMVKGHSQPGTTSTNIDEALGGATKKRAPMAHMGPASTSHECEALGGMAKKKPSMVDPGGAGDAAPYMR
jgi:hypothetical protein